MVRLYDSYSGLKFSSYKSEEMELILLFKSRIIQILMQNVATILQFTHSDKSNHWNRVIQIVPCKAAIMAVLQERFVWYDLYDSTNVNMQIARS